MTVLRSFNMVATNFLKRISRLSSGTLSHSMQVGNLTSFPPKDFAVSPETRCPYLTSFEPLQVDRKYLFFFPFTPNLSANTGVIIDALLYSSIKSYTGLFSGIFSRKMSIKMILLQDSPPLFALHSSMLVD